MFEDYSIREEQLEDGYEEEEIIHPVMESNKPLRIIPMEEDMNSSFHSMGSFWSSSHSDCKLPLAGPTTIGSQIYRSINENKYSGIFSKKYCKFSTLGEELNFSIAQLSGVTGDVREGSVENLNAVVKKSLPLNSVTSCMSINGDSDNNTVVEDSPMDYAWNYCPSECPERIEPIRTSNKITASPTLHKEEEKKTECSPTTNKLRIPKMVNFSFLPSFSSKLLPNMCKNEARPIERAQIQFGTLNQLSTSSCLKESEIDGKSTKSRTSVISENTFNDRLKNLSLRQSSNDDQSTDDDFLIGRLTKAQRAEKVRKYLEKKKRRKWDKKVNYQSRKKVADTRPRYKGRFVSSELAGQLAEELKDDLNRRLEKDKVFITEIIDRCTGKVKKTIFPNEQVLRRYRNNAFV